MQLTLYVQVIVKYTCEIIINIFKNNFNHKKIIFKLYPHCGIPSSWTTRSVFSKPRCLPHIKLFTFVHYLEKNTDCTSCTWDKQI